MDTLTTRKISKIVAPDTFPGLKTIRIAFAEKLSPGPCWGSLQRPRPLDGFPGREGGKREGQGKQGGREGEREGLPKRVVFPNEKAR